MKAVLFILALALVAYCTGLPIISSPPANQGGIFRYNENKTCESNYSCAGEGDDCTANCSFTDGNCCALGLQCYNSECATDNIGDTCSVPSDCFSQYSGVEVTCLNGTCALQYYTNDECEDNSDCVSNNCTDEVCVGFPEGHSCDGFNSKQCGYGLACTQDAYDQYFSCSPLVASGGACDSDSECYFGYVCASAKCIPSYSVEEGDACTPLSTQECEGDLVCSGGKCVEGQEWDETDCDSDEDCPTGQYCYCSLYSGDTICLGNSANYSIGDSATELWDCIRDHNCTALSDAPDSCAQENCDSDYSDTEDDYCTQSDALYDSCFTSPVCGGFPVWAIIVIAVVAVILVLVIIVVAVMCMKRKRNDYDSI